MLNITYNYFLYKLLMSQKIGTFFAARKLKVKKSTGFEITPRHTPLVYLKNNLLLHNVQE